MSSQFDTNGMPKEVETEIVAEKIVRHSDWQKKFVQDLKDLTGISHEHAFAALGLACEENTNAYLQGHSRGYNQGHAEGVIKGRGPVTGELTVNVGNLEYIRGYNDGDHASSANKVDISMAMEYADVVRSKAYKNGYNDGWNCAVERSLRDAGYNVSRLEEPKGCGGNCQCNSKN